jgi:hypothetical protein
MKKELKMNETHSKSSSRYKKWLILWFLFFILFSMILLVNSFIQGNYSIYPILTQNFWLDMTILFLSIPFMSMVAFIIGGYTLTPLLLYIHRKILGRYLNYGIREVIKPKEFKRAFTSSIFPALLAFNIGILLSDQTTIHTLIFNESFQSTPLIIRQILTLVILLPLVSFIAVAAFSGVNFILDSGIEYTNKNKKKVLEGTYPIEVRSVGGYYLYFLKGYTGLSVIIIIIQLIFRYILALQGTDVLIFTLNLVIWPIMPFIIALFIAPTFVLKDYTFEKRKSFTRKWAYKFDIKAQLEDPLGRK